MLDRQVAPLIQPLASVTLPAADVFMLPNGARLHIMRNDAQPVVRLQVVFRAGKWYESEAGVALLTARMLLEGTKKRTARQIADEVAFYGASLECEQGFDRATLTLYCLSRHLEKLLPLIEDVLTSPIFPEEELSLLKQRTIQNIRIERQKTSYLAAERFSQNLFGPKHPYGSVIKENDFKNISRDHITSFHQVRYRFEEAEIFLCGHISSEHRESIISGISELRTPNVNHSSVSHIPTVTHQVLHDYVPAPDSIQASLRIGRLWPSSNHPDAHQLQVLIKVLGGYFGSRLMKNIREDKGFTYGIYASINLREHYNSLVIGTDVNATSSSAAIREIHHELNKLQEELIPREELQTVKNYINGKFANELSTVFEQCDKYKNIILFKLSESYYDNFVKHVNTVQPETLRQLAQSYLSPGSFIEVVSGP